MTVWPDWTGETAVVVASGPSAADVNLEAGRGRAKFLAVKDGWKLCPWADYLYGCDHHWWEAHKGVVEFAQGRICYDKRTKEKWRGFDWLQVEISRPHQCLVFDTPGKIGWGMNSGFHALNLVLQWNASKVILVGFDMRVDHGRHFFGEHKYSKAPSEANVKRWAEIIDGEADRIAARGVRVVNCSPVSALRRFPKMTFEAALEE